MKAPTFSAAQKAFVSKQEVGGVPVVGICRKVDISQGTR